MCGLQWRRYRFTWKQQILPAGPTGEICAGYNGGDIVLPGSNSFSQLASLQQFLPAGPTVEICAGYNGGDIVLSGSNSFSQLASLVKYVRVTMAEILFYLEATVSPSLPHW
ncbi:hypothetical protein RRG08_052584 [Elysia crispata]|uniref:Uncharacterized protein n=1 Tax=Elysia crispata TaxID=231223 RepID=A0AAE1A1S6_9GAST|nr:hypothetical protein RRG08_052584 [Elysia crispata]